MKKYLAALFLLVFFKTNFAQTKKGAFVLSGKTDLNFLFSNTTVGTDSIETGKGKNNQFGFTLGAGYFIADNFSIAVSGAYLYKYSKTEPGFTENITTSLGIIPQLSYYFPVEGKLRPFAAVGVGYMWQKERDSRITGNNNIAYSVAGPSFNAGAGVSYFIIPSVAIDLEIQYSHNRLKEQLQKIQTQTQNIVAGSLGISVYL